MNGHGRTRRPHRATKGPPSATAKLNLWVGQLFLWPARGLYVGHAADTVAHTHHAIQVCIGLDDAFRLRSGVASPWRKYAAVVIAADAVHQLEGGQGPLALLYVDPESDEGRRLTSSARGSAFVPVDAARRDVIQPLLCRCQERTSSDEAAAIFDRTIEVLTAVRERQRRLDSRIARALERLRSVPPKRLSLRETAAAVSLSPSGFAHLFRADTGLPLRRYLLWLRLVEAVREMGRSTSLTEAAHAAGFADSAHLTRTFRRMFGVTPSALARGSQVIQA